MGDFKKIDIFIITVATIIAGACAWYLLGDFEFESQGQLKIGLVVQSENDVRRRLKETSVFRKLKVQQRLFLDDQIYSGPNSSAELHLDDGTQIRLRENALIQLSRVGEQLQMNLTQGEIEIIDHAKKLIKVKAPRRGLITQIIEHPSEETSAPTAADTPVETVVEVAEAVRETTQEPAPEPERIHLATPAFDIQWKPASREQRRNGTRSLVEINLGKGHEIQMPLRVWLSADPNFKDSVRQTLKSNKESLKVPFRKDLQKLYVRAQYILPRKKRGKDNQRLPSQADGIDPEYVLPPAYKQELRLIETRDLNMPKPIYPKMNQSILSQAQGNILFKWALESGAEAYEIQISQDPDFQNAEIKASARPEFFEPTFGLKNGLWYWRVRAYNELTESVWSAPRSFYLFVRHGR